MVPLLRAKLKHSVTDEPQSSVLRSRRAVLACCEADTLEVVEILDILSFAAVRFSE